MTADVDQLPLASKLSARVSLPDIVNELFGLPPVALSVTVSPVTGLVGDTDNETVYVSVTVQFSVTELLLNASVIVVLYEPAGEV